MTQDNELRMIDIIAPKYPVEIDIRSDGQVLRVSIGHKCVLRICQINSICLNDKRNKQVKGQNARNLNK